MIAELFALEDADCSPATEAAVLELPSAICEQKAAERMRGDIAELRFCEKARLLGFDYRLMGGSCKGYDVILECEGMRPMFVQVKHGFLREQRDRSRFYAVKNNVSNKPYSHSAYDVLAFYMWDRAQWLLYRRSELGDRSGTTWTPPEIRVRAHQSRATAARDPNNWELLNDVKIQLSAVSNQ